MRLSFQGVARRRVVLALGDSRESVDRSLEQDLLEFLHIGLVAKLILHPGGERDRRIHRNGGWFLGGSLVSFGFGLRDSGLFGVLIRLVTSCDFLLLVFLGFLLVLKRDILLMANQGKRAKGNRSS